MAQIEPYAPCPCGSGEKYKWCCQKVEPVLQKAGRLLQSGQFDAAIEVVDDGLKKHPGEVFLLTNKAAILIDREDFAGAREVLIEVVRLRPNHLPSLIFLISLDSQLDGVAAGGARLQQALTAVAPEVRVRFARPAGSLGKFYLDEHKSAAALAHVRLAARLDEDDTDISGMLDAVLALPTLEPIQKQDYALTGAPETLDAARRARFDEALGWARDGLWSSAAAVFDLLFTDAGHDLELAAACAANAGLCRMWVGDDAGATACLRQAVARLGVCNAAVEFEALCQVIDPGRRDDRVEQIRWIWPLRDREKLLAALRADKAICEEGPDTIDREDENSPEVLAFSVLDRAALPVDRLHPRKLQSAAEIPIVQGRFLVGQEIGVVEAYDDGRLDALGDRFRALAGTAIPPAHPRMKVISRINREHLALAWEWQSAGMIDLHSDEKLARDQRRHIDAEVWPNTKFRYLNNRTPKKAAADGDAEVALRAALLLRRDDCNNEEQFEKLETVRRRLSIPGEPALDPAKTDIETVHLSRLVDIDIARLDDERLQAYSRRAQRHAVTRAIERALRLLIDRTPPHERTSVEARSRVTLLIDLLLSRRNLVEAAEWLERARAAESDATRALAAPHWDMTEIRLRLQTEEPDVWVPELVLVLDRYRGDKNAAAVTLRHLIDLGFVQVVANPDKPSDLMLDSRILQMLLAEYGPRVTTASGELGISATRGEIWTPNAGAGGGAKGGLWTPGGSTAASTAEKAKLIIPGR